MHLTGRECQAKKTVLIANSTSLALNVRNVGTNETLARLSIYYISA